MNLNLNAREEEAIRHPAPPEKESHPGSISDLLPQESPQASPDKPCPSSKKEHTDSLESSAGEVHTRQEREEASPSHPHVSGSRTWETQETPGQKLPRGKRQEGPDAIYRGQPAAVPAPRRVGTFTMGLALIAAGLLILLLMLFPNFDFGLLFMFPPLLLIVLGGEIILRFCLSKDHHYRYDVFGIFLCFVLVCGSIAAACLPRVLEYWGPQRHQAEDQLTQQLDEDLYLALKNTGVIAGMDITLYAEPDLLAGSQTYFPSYTGVTLRLLPQFPGAEDFASQCRLLMDHLQESGLSPRLDHLEFIGSGPNLRYSLRVQDRFQWDLNEGSLAELTESVKLEPDPADGWLPGGYEEMLDTFGPEVADAFLKEAIQIQSERIGTSANDENTEPSLAEESGETGNGSQESSTSAEEPPEDASGTGPASPTEAEEAETA